MVEVSVIPHYGEEEVSDLLPLTGQYTSPPLLRLLLQLHWGGEEPATLH